MSSKPIAGKVYWAPKGTTLPTDTIMPTTFTELGYITEDDIHPRYLANVGLEGDVIWDPFTRTASATRERADDAALVCDMLASKMCVGRMVRRVMYRDDLDGPWHVEVTYAKADDN